MTAPLTPADLAAHRRLGISADVLARAGVGRVDDAQARDMGIRYRGALAGIWYPRIDPWTGHVVGGRVRRDVPEYENGKPLNKYVSTYGDRPHLYLSCTDADALADLSRTVVIPEAEKSCQTLASLAPDVVPVGVGGCWGWRGTVGKVETPEGARADEKGPSPDLDRIGWQGRDVVIWFDANVTTNPKVQAAERALAHELSRRGARVRLARMPETPHVNGLDDYAAAHGADAAQAIADVIARAMTCVTVRSTPPDAGTVSRLELARADSIAPEPIRWLWPDWIALGKTTIIAGHPGLGKSQLTCWMAAAVSTGGPLPGGGRAPLGDVILVSAEDDPADTVIPRLMAAGADLSRIHLLQAAYVTTPDGRETERGFNLQEDVPTLAATLAGLPDVRLVVVDPITAYMGKSDTHRTSDVRAVLRPVERLAQAMGVAIVMISHLNKGGGNEALMRVTGSLAFVAAARAGYLVARDPENDDQRLFLSTKINIAPETSGLAFCVEGIRLDCGIGTSRIAWTGEPVTVTANEALAAQGTTVDPSERSRTDEAADWLQEALADGPQPPKVLQAWAKRDGLAWRTIQRAKVPGLDRGRAGFGTGSLWRIDPPFAPTDTHSRHDSGSGANGANGANGTVCPTSHGGRITLTDTLAGGESPTSLDDKEAADAESF